MANAVEISGGGMAVTATIASGTMATTATLSGPFNGDGSVKVNWSEYPSSATVLHVTTVGAAAALSASLASTASQTTYLQGYAISGGGATAAATLTATISGLTGTNMAVGYFVTTGTTIGSSPVIVNFTRAIPASGTNISVTINLPSLGAGNSSTVLSIFGYRAP